MLGSSLFSAAVAIAVFAAPGFFLTPSFPPAAMFVFADVGLSVLLSLLLAMPLPWLLAILNAIIVGILIHY